MRTIRTEACSTLVIVSGYHYIAVSARKNLPAHYSLTRRRRRDRAKDRLARCNLYFCDRDRHSRDKRQWPRYSGAYCRPYPRNHLMSDHERKVISTASASKLIAFFRESDYLEMDSAPGREMGRQSVSQSDDVALTKALYQIGSGIASPLPSLSARMRNGLYPWH